MKNQQITTNLAGHGSRKLPRRSLLPAHCLLLTVLLSLLIVLCSLFIACDLLNSPVNNDFLGKIDAEIAWANAASLSVNMAYPTAWGTSNPQQGTITPAIDIRQGYAFTIEFTPAAAYSLLEWRAYSTAALAAITGWRDSPYTLLVETAIPQIDGVILPEPNPNGGAGSFTINTTEPVTLIPWSIDMPRVISTDPPMNNSGIFYQETKAVTVDFAAPINPNTAVFGSDYITITMRTIDENGAPYGTSEHIEGIHYQVPVLSNGNRTLTFNVVTGNPPPEYSEITVTIGTGIESELSANTMSEQVSFSWIVLNDVDFEISNWKAAVNSSGTQIDINWDITTSSPFQVTVTAFFYQNYGTRQNASEAIIRTPELNSGGVASGNAVSNIQRYDIYLEISYSTVTTTRGTITIWNIPGMDVAHGSPIVEISTAGELAAMSDNLAGQYALVNNITVSAWKPVGTGGTDGDPFTGKFYGNGHTVTIGNMNSAQHMGLFGALGGNSIVRDLMVNYGSLSVSRTEPPSDDRSTYTYFGGIAGEARGNAHIQNIVVRGYATITVNAIYAGGLVGWMQENPGLDNAYAALNLAINSGGGRAMIGGAIGASADTGFTYNGTISNCSAVAGTIDVTKGAAGIVDDRLRLGGFIGNFNQGKLEGCYSENMVSFNQTSKFNDVAVGGFAGRVDGGISISYSYAKGSVSATVMTEGSGWDDGGKIGGFTGFLDGGLASYCYASGDVGVISKSGSVSAGGFAGLVRDSSTFSSGRLENCYALGNIFVDIQDNTGHRLDAGGLIGRNATTSGSVSRSFAKGTVIGYNAGNASSNIGGLIGGTQDSSILTNSVALNEYLVVTTSFQFRVVRRLYGNSANITGSSNNYAYNDMVLYYSETNGVGINDGRMEIRGAENNIVSNDGRTINMGSFKDPNFWQNAPPTSNSSANYIGLGFSGNDWIFTGIQTRGYPILRASKNGPALGGQ